MYSLSGLSKLDKRIDKNIRVPKFNSTLDFIDQTGTQIGKITYAF